MGWLDFKQDIDFMSYRRYFVGASLLLVVAAVVAIVKPGPRYGTDFVGGTEVEVAFKGPVTAGELRTAVQKIGFKSPDVLAVANETNSHQFLIRVQEVSSLSDEQQAAISAKLCLVGEDESAAAVDAAACPPALRSTEVKFSPGGDKVSVRYAESPCGPAQPGLACPPRADIAAQLGVNLGGVELRDGVNNPVVQNPRDHKVEFFFKSKGDQIMDGLRGEIGAELVPDSALRVEWIGPKAGKQLRDAAIKSIFFALIAIMLYVAFRFDVRFAPGGIVALAHDVTLAVGAMVLARREVTLSTVAALLTIVGYSINDTVVVYDRIRENLGKYRKMTFPRVINRSITEVLARSVKTSATTALAMVPFLIWGTGVIKDFAFTLLVGIVVGTYSSIYIAAPITEYIDRKVFSRFAKKKKRTRVPRKGGGAGKQAEFPAV